MAKTSHCTPPIKTELALSNWQYSLGKQVPDDRSFCVSQRKIMRNDEKHDHLLTITAVPSRLVQIVIVCSFFFFYIAISDAFYRVLQVSGCQRLQI